jgi:hypothetical protein
MAGPSQSSIQKLSDQIDNLLDRYDVNANKHVTIIADGELVELLGPDFQEPLIEHHMALFPECRGARNITVIVSTVPRDCERSRIDQASWDLVRAARAAKQQPKALEFWVEPTTDQPQ